MTDSIREAVRVELAKRKWSKSELARRINKSPQFIGQIMNNRRGDVPEYWQEIFDELGLELTVTAKNDTQKTSSTKGSSTLLQKQKSKRGE